MTKEQLAKLEEQAQWDDPTEDGGGEDLTEWLLPTGALRRLLEERKRLLEALRPFAEGANSIRFRKMMMEVGLEWRAKEVQAADAAIAFAEEPAR